MVFLFEKGDVMKKEYRVKKSSDIEMIIKKRQSRANGHFVLYKKENHENNHFRFAVSVSKKYGNAVKRNRIKRQVREIISKIDVLPKYDIFIVVKSNIPQLTYAQLEASLSDLIFKQKIMR